MTATLRTLSDALTGVVLTHLHAHLRGKQLQEALRCRAVLKLTFVPGQPIAMASLARPNRYLNERQLAQLEADLYQELGRYHGAHRGSVKLDLKLTRSEPEAWKLLIQAAFSKPGAYPG